MKPEILTHEQIDWSEPLLNGDKYRVQKNVTYRVPDGKFNAYNIFKVGHNVVEDGDYFCEDGWVYKLDSIDSYSGPRICQWGIRFNFGHGDQIHIKYSRFSDPNKFERYIRKLAYRKRKKMLKVHSWINDKIFLALPFYAFRGHSETPLVFEASSDSTKGKCNKSFSWRWISNDSEGKKSFEAIKQDFNYKLDQELCDLHFKCDRYRMNGWGTIGRLTAIFKYFVFSILECKFQKNAYETDQIMRVIFNKKEYIYLSGSFRDKEVVDFFNKPIVYDFRKKGVRNGN